MRADDLQRLREVWDGIPAPSEEQHQRARHRLLSAIEDTPSRRHPVTAGEPPPVAMAAPPSDAPEVRTGPRRRLVAAIAVAALLLAVLAISWQAERALRSPRLPVIDRGEPDIPVPTAPLPLRTEPDVDLTGEPAGQQYTGQWGHVFTGGGVTVTTYVPEAPGPWPVVVMVPRWLVVNDPEPAPLYREVVPMAMAIAERGVVVHLVKNLEVSLSEGAYVEPALDAKGTPYAMATTACALRYARATAPDHGALGDHLVLVGYDTGAWSGALVALTDGTPDLPAGPCTAPEMAAPPTAFVGFAGRYGCASYRDGAWLERVSLAAKCANDTAPGEGRVVAGPGLVPVEYAGHRPDVPFRLVAPSHSAWGAPVEDEALGAALRDGGHPIKVQVVGGASPGDFLTLGTAASDATIAQVLDVARQ